MTKLINLILIGCFCSAILYAQDNSDKKSRFYKIDITEHSAVVAKEPDKDVLIKGNPYFKTWALDSLSKELTSGVWESTPGKWKFSNAHWEYCRILSGVSIITEDNGNSFTVKAGDSFILKPGFTGIWEVVKTTRKDFVAVESNKDNGLDSEKSQIIKTIEYYIDGGRKGDSKITAKAFSSNAIMSWSENGTLESVPIQVLYDIVDKGGAMSADYKMKNCNIQANVAIVQIESQFGDTNYIDMFTLVKEENVWKITSKVYTTL